VRPPSKAAHVKFYAENEYEQALKELVDLDLVEEMPNLGERWRLVVKEKGTDATNSPVAS